MSKSILRNGLLYGLLGALATGAVGAATPTPPASICLDGTCKSSAIATAAAVSATGKGVKFHPGVYAYYTAGAINGIPGHRWDLSGQRAKVLAFIDSICSESNIKGVQLIALWRTLEGATPGDYSAGFSAVDTILAKLTSCNKRLILTLQAAWFGNIGSQYDLYPNYIIDDSTYGVTFFTPATGSTSRVWQQATADRKIALSAAYGARYNGNPNFEMMGLYGETALQLNSDGYSVNALLTQIKRVYAAARGHWPNTGLKVWVNDAGGDDTFVDLYNTCKTYYCVIGNPDTWPGDITQSDRIFVGKNTSGANVYEDLRDKLPWSANVDWQSFNLDSSGHPKWSLQQLWDVHTAGYTPTSPNGQGSFAMPSMKARYAGWYANESNGNSENQWATAELAFLRSHASWYATAACPTLYPACITQ